MLDVLAAAADGEPGFPGPLRLVRAWPALRRVPACVIGVGVLPEHAPAFARRHFRRQ